MRPPHHRAAGDTAQGACRCALTEGAEGRAGSAGARAPSGRGLGAGPRPSHAAAWEWLFSRLKQRRARARVRPSARPSAFAEGRRGGGRAWAPPPAPGCFAATGASGGPRFTRRRPPTPGKRAPGVPRRPPTEPRDRVFDPLLPEEAPLLWPWKEPAAATGTNPSPAHSPGSRTGPARRWAAGGGGRRRRRLHHRPWDSLTAPPPPAQAALRAPSTADAPPPQADTRVCTLGHQVSLRRPGPVGVRRAGAGRWAAGGGAREKAPGKARASASGPHGPSLRQRSPWNLEVTVVTPGPRLDKCHPRSDAGPPRAAPSAQGSPWRSAPRPPRPAGRRLGNPPQVPTQPHRRGPHGWARTVSIPGLLSVLAG